MPQSPEHKPGLSVFFPAYNDSGTIASLVITALQSARRLTPDCEIIIVNDGSADATASIADELARTYPEVRVVHHERNRGYGGALRSGFASATREFVFYTDGDAQSTPPRWRCCGNGSTTAWISWMAGSAGASHAPDRHGPGSTITHGQQLFTGEVRGVGATSA
jgi:hypothetical protein